MDHDTDKAGQVVYICYVPKDYYDKDARRTQSFTPDKVRVLYAPSKMLLSETPQPPKTTMPESPAKRIADFIANAEDAIANGYRTEWEPGVYIWQLRQCSDRAQSLNSSLYGPVVTTITDQRLKTQVTEGCDGDLVRLLLNLRKRFGSNAGVIQIHNAAEFGNLKPFTSSANLGHELKTFLTYHDQTDPNLAPRKGIPTNWCTDPSTRG